MAITETARRNRETLFPGYVSKLAETDPEFVELFNNFAFDEALGFCELDRRTSLLAALAALIAQHAVSEYKAMLAGALNAGFKPVEAREIVYQSVAYVGIGPVFDMLQATNEVFAGRGIPLPLTPQATTTAESRLERGLELSKSVFGHLIDRLYYESPEGQEHIQQMISSFAFGDFYTRSGLGMPERELVTFVLLATLGGCDSQLKAHIQGNATVGNDKRKMVAVLTGLIPLLGFPRTLNALRCVNEALAE